MKFFSFIWISKSSLVSPGLVSIFYEALLVSLPLWEVGSQWLGTLHVWKRHYSFILILFWCAGSVFYFLLLWHFFGLSFGFTVYREEWSLQRILKRLKPNSFFLWLTTCKELVGTYFIPDASRRPPPTMSLLKDSFVFHNHPHGWGYRRPVPRRYYLVDRRSEPHTERGCFYTMSDSSVLAAEKAEMHVMAISTKIYKLNETKEATHNKNQTQETQPKAPFPINQRSCWHKASGVLCFGDGKWFSGV